MLCHFNVRYQREKVFLVVATITKYSGSLAEILKFGEDACRIVFGPAGRGG